MRPTRSSIAGCALMAAACIVAGCSTNSMESERRCAQGADADCPPGTPARVESDYRKDVSSIDRARCRAIAGDSADAYRTCLSRYESDRR
jgi:hypothetical protein